MYCFVGLQRVFSSNVSAVFFVFLTICNGVVQCKTETYVFFFSKIQEIFMKTLQKKEANSSLARLNDCWKKAQRLREGAFKERCERLSILTLVRRREGKARQRSKVRSCFRKIVWKDAAECRLGRRFYKRNRKTQEIVPYIFLTENFCKKAAVKRTQRPWNIIGRSC